MPTYVDHVYWARLNDRALDQTYDKNSKFARKSLAGQSGVQIAIFTEKFTAINLELPI